MFAFVTNCTIALQKKQHGTKRRIPIQRGILQPG